MSDDKITITTVAGTSLVLGDMITFSSRVPWWRLVLRRLGLMKTPKPRLFVVTGVTQTTAAVQESAGWGSAPDYPA